MVRLADRPDRLDLLAFPAGSRTVAFGDAGERLRSRVAGGTWELAIDGRRTRRYRLTAALSAAGVSLGRPCSVTVGGRRLPRRAWRFAAGSAVLEATFRVRRGTLRVTSCGTGGFTGASTR